MGSVQRTVIGKNGAGEALLSGPQRQTPFFAVGAGAVDSPSSTAKLDEPALPRAVLPPAGEAVAERLMRWKDQRKETPHPALRATFPSRGRLWGARAAGGVGPYNQDKKLLDETLPMLRWRP